MTIGDIDALYLAPGRGHPKIFGQILGEWLEGIEKSQNDLAEAVGVDPSAVSHWMAGRKLPSRQTATRILIKLHSWLRGDWQVSEVLDGMVGLGLGWEDVAASLEEYRPGGMDKIKKWWEAGKPQRLPGPSWPLPADYVEPEELEPLLRRVTGEEGYRQPVFNGVVVHGISGAGKTTLAVALARSEVAEWVFREGILWLDGSAQDLIEQVRRKVVAAWDRAAQSQGESEEEGAAHDPNTVKTQSLDEWSAWIGADERRLLIVIDDLTDAAQMRDLLRQVGRQVIVLVTTQRGSDVAQEMERWCGPERFTEVEITGLSERKAREFVEKILGRGLSEAEWGVVEEIGELVGWHPEGLRLAAWKAREHHLTWRDLLLDLGDVEEGTVLDRLEVWVERHWGRMKSWEQEQARRLLHMMEEGLPFQVGFASAAWGVETGQARVRLLRLERDGLIERMEAAPRLPWQSQDEAIEQWRPLPIVYRVMAERSLGRLDKRKRRLKRYFWRWKERLTGFYRSEEAPHPPPPPFVFRLVVLVVSTLIVPFKYVVYMALRGLRWFFPQKRWAERLDEWIIAGAAKDHIRAQWDRRGVQATEGLLLIYWGKDQLAGVTLTVFVVSGVLALIPSFPGYVWVAISVGVVLAAGAYLPWCTWLACFYGAYTWDLELMLRISLWITSGLSWIPALRKEREALREALRRVKGDSRGDEDKTKNPTHQAAAN